MLRNPFEKISEIQAHSTEVTRLCITADNKHVFSAGNDGSLCCFVFEDKDLDKELARKMITHSSAHQFDDIMLQLETKINLHNEISNLANDINNVNMNNERSLKEKCDANDVAGAALQKQ
jgi:hypothetical protein